MQFQEYAMLSIEANFAIILHRHPSVSDQVFPVVARSRHLALRANAMYARTNLGLLCLAGLGRDLVVAVETVPGEQWKLPETGAWSF